jgi:hypothetical protein
MVVAVAVQLDNRLLLIMEQQLLVGHKATEEVAEVIVTTTVTVVVVATVEDTVGITEVAEEVVIMEVSLKFEKLSNNHTIKLKYFQRWKWGILWWRRWRFKLLH